MRSSRGGKGVGSGDANEVPVKTRDDRREEGGVVEMVWEKRSHNCSLHDATTKTSILGKR